jgi:hypothetical protein
MTCNESKVEFAGFIATRSCCIAADFEVRPCAALVMAALRLADADKGLTVVVGGQRHELMEMTD